MGQVSKFWNFERNSDLNQVILRISGDIIEDDDAWLYEWFGMQAASPNAFRTELAQHAGKNIDVWIDSYGGSVFAGTGIYNALMEHKNTGAAVNTIIDGKAMSAATIPFMAGDKRKITPGGIFMMHNPLTSSYGYASDLRKSADVLDVVKDTIINAYQLGTGLDREKISDMMDQETYMSASTAIREGFATEMLYGEQENITNLIFNRLAIKNASNDSMKRFFEVTRNFVASQEPPMEPAANIQKNEEDTVVEIKNADDLRKIYPDFVDQIEIGAVAQERKRIQDIEQIANIIDPELLNKAKFSEPMEAEKLAFQNAVLQSQRGTEYLKNAQQDSDVSGVKNVTSIPTDGVNVDETAKQAKQEKTVNSIVDAVNKLRG
ncbi:MAG: clpP1 [Firmicutes bacterium]|nr:clpP1 [Bacillota bacterium]